jgi:hypothetical protein
VIADHPTSWQAVVSALNSMNRISIRRAKMMGLDAPMKFDVRGIYGVGHDEMMAERRDRERILEAMPMAERAHLFEVFRQARIDADAGVFPDSTPTTATVIDESNDRNSNDDPAPGHGNTDIHQ